jgi:hypothetical protein
MPMVEVDLPGCSAVIAPLGLLGARHWWFMREGVVLVKCISLICTTTVECNRHDLHISLFSSVSKSRPYGHRMFFGMFTASLYVSPF